jgi:hypothetical protein
MSHQGDFSKSIGPRDTDTGKDPDTDRYADTDRDTVTDMDTDTDRINGVMTISPMSHQKIHELPYKTFWHKADKRKKKT